MEKEIRTDYCIAGGGIAGVLLASRLSASGKQAPHTSAEAKGPIAPCAHQRLLGVGGTALHFEGLMIRPREEDMRVRSLYGYGRDWPITYSR